MTVLFRGLQIQGSYFYKSQQPLSLYRYKEFELQIGLLGPKALLISFLNQLLPKQGKYGYKCIMKVFIKKLR